MKKPKPAGRGAPKGNANAAKSKKEKRVPLQVRISAESAKLLKQHTKEHGNAGRALDWSISRTWLSKDELQTRVDKDAWDSNFVDEITKDSDRRRVDITRANGETETVYVGPNEVIPMLKKGDVAHMAPIHEGKRRVVHGPGASIVGS